MNQFDRNYCTMYILGVWKNVSRMINDSVYDLQSNSSEWKLNSSLGRIQWVKRERESLISIWKNGSCTCKHQDSRLRQLVNMSAIYDIRTSASVNASRQAKRKFTNNVKPMAHLGLPSLSRLKSLQNEKRRKRSDLYLHSSGLSSQRRR